MRSLAAKTFLTIVVCGGLGLLTVEAENDPSQAQGSTVSSKPVFENSMLVLDVSGSMWGQLEGIAKIQIARDALKSLVSNWPSERLVGLVAYGHRQKGDCADIETVVPVGTLDKASLGATVDRLTPRGMTPLTAAVKHAAEELKYSEQKATVILISDGVETCDLDPCEVGAELESLGVDFTAHVIGFDVTNVEDEAGLRCLAETTGGLFISAANAAQLNEALEEATQAAEEKPAAVPQASLTVPASATKGTEVKVQITSEEGGLRGYLYLYPEGKDKSISYVRVEEVTVGSGYDDATVRLPAQIGKFTLRWENSARQVLAEATIETLEATITLEVPESATMGTAIPVKITAPQGLDGYLYLYPEGKDKSVGYVRVTEAKVGSGYEDATIRLPAQIGKFSLRWENSARHVLAETTVETLEASVTLEAPESAIMGTAFLVQLTAPDGLDGYVYLYPKGKDKYVSYARVQEAKVGIGYQPAEIRLPATPGDFVLKWESSKQETLAETPVVSTEAEFEISAPSEAVAGTEVTVEVEAPNGLEGYVYLYAEGKDKSISYARVFEDEISGYKPMKLRLPVKPGVYQLKWQSSDTRTIAETVVTATEAAVSLQTTKEVPIATPLEVEITAPAGLAGYLYLYAKGKEKSLTYSRVQEKSDGTYSANPLRLPATPGTYEVKFETDSKEVLAETDVEVKASDISLSAPKLVEPKQKFSVELSAPAGIRGYLYLYARGKEKSLEHYRVSPGSINDYESITVVAPETIGEYELMWLSENDEVLGTSDFSVAVSRAE